MQNDTEDQTAISVRRKLSILSVQFVNAVLNHPHNARSQKHLSSVMDVFNLYKTDPLPIVAAADDQHWLHTTIKTAFVGPLRLRS